MELSSAVTSLNGIGEKTARKFAAAGIYTLQDLISYYPRDYETFDPCEDGEDELTDGRVSAVCAFLRKPLSVRYAGRYKITTGSISAFGKEIRLVWFNMPYLKNTLRPGSRYVFRGRVKRTRNTVSLQQPKVYPPDEYEKLAGMLRPVYRLHQGLTEGMIDRAVSRALEVLEEKRRRTTFLCGIWNVSAWSLIFRLSDGCISRTQKNIICRAGEGSHLTSSCSSSSLSDATGYCREACGRAGPLCRRP